MDFIVEVSNFLMQLYMKRYVKLKTILYWKNDVRPLRGAFKGEDE